MAVVKDAYSAVANFTITLASLANSAAGVGRQSTLIDNSVNLYQGALISVNLKMGTTPTANSLIYVYLIRSDKNTTAIIDDAAGTTDAALTVVNAPLLGTLVVSAATTGLVIKGLFDTRGLGALAPQWGIALVNGSGVALDATAGNHVVSWQGISQTVI